MLVESAPCSNEVRSPPQIFETLQRFRHTDKKRCQYDAKSPRTSAKTRHTEESSAILAFSQSRKHKRYSEMLKKTSPVMGRTSIVLSNDKDRRAEQSKDETKREDRFTQPVAYHPTLGVGNGAAINPKTWGAALEALLASQEQPTQAGDCRRGEMRSCKKASAMVPMDGPIATGRLETTSGGHSLSFENNIQV